MSRATVQFTPGADNRAPASPWATADRKPRARHRKRDAVIRTAARAFNERGYHNTSLDDIAALLDVTKPTIYYYVDNKEQLLFECFRTGLEPIREAFGEVRRPAGAGATATRAGHTRLCGRHRVRLRLVHGARRGPGPGPAMSSQIKTLKSEIDQGIRRLLREGREDGSIRECDPKLTAFAMAGALNWIAHWYRAMRR